MNDPATYKYYLEIRILESLKEISKYYEFLGKPEVLSSR